MAQNIFSFSEAKKYIQNILEDIRNKKSSYWLKVREKEILKVFHSTAQRVPAYKDFLKRNKINPEKIKTLKDFEHVPPINKDNYLRYYPLNILFKDGKLNKQLTFHSTSGTTGEPQYFAREYWYDLRRTIILSYFLTNNSKTLNSPVLFIVSFGMGVWSAGTGMYIASYLANNILNFPLSIISPGVNRTETLKIFKKLLPYFKQVIICGYPPLIKDIIDDALIEKINLKKIDFRYIFTGEAFPEELRDYLASNIRVNNIFVDTMNTYGTSEFGPTAIETPLSIFVKRFAFQHNNLKQAIFGEIEKTPTVCQYIPYFVNFECINGELWFTGDSSIPLVRYQSGDNGGILTFDEVKEKFLSNSFDLIKEMEKNKILDFVNGLPFVYVYERKNLATTLYGILIYPEFIRSALFDKELTKFLTGKFTMLTKYDSKQNQYLEINLELKRNVTFNKSFKEIALKKIVNTLREKSSEYRELSNNLKEHAYPRLVFWPYEHEKYFKIGSKQKWTIRENDKE